MSSWGSSMWVVVAETGTTTSGEDGDDCQPEEAVLVSSNFPHLVLVSDSQEVASI